MTLIAQFQLAIEKLRRAHYAESLERKARLIDHYFLLAPLLRGGERPLIGPVREESEMV
ncbi:hypothetical protein ACWTU6_31370 [Mesorhizobium sp. BHbsci]